MTITNPVVRRAFESGDLSAAASLQCLVVAERARRWLRSHSDFQDSIKAQLDEAVSELDYIEAVQKRERDSARGAA